MSSSSPPTLHEQRAQLGREALYSLTRAARLMPGRDTDNVALFRAWGIVRKVGAMELVRWGDVLDMVAASGQHEQASQLRRGLGRR